MSHLSAKILEKKKERKMSIHKLHVFAYFFKRNKKGSFGIVNIYKYPN